MPNLKSVHLPTLIIALVVIVVVVGLYHATLGRKG